jgi:hypothetical protein
MYIEGVVDKIRPGSNPGFGTTNKDIHNGCDKLTA